jgi:hypothetical protein
MKHCFVISPIGQEGSEARKHANDVFKYIIQPAMKRCGIKPFRSDHLEKPGKISKHMFHAIYSSDLCIAVLTDKNPNVFYELAVAQHARKPVIILIHKDQQLPFDVFDFRCVSYELDIRSYRRKTYINAVINHIKECEATGWQADDIFGKYAPRPQRVNGQDFFESSGKFGGDDEWLDLLRQTQARLDLMGISLAAWRRNPGFRKIAKQKADAGCRLRFLLIDKDNEGLHAYTSHSAKLAALVDDISRSTDYYRSLAEECPNVEVRHLYHNIPHFSLACSDQCAMVIMYLSAHRWNKGPLWRSDTGTGLYKIVSNEFDQLWDLSEPIAMNPKKKAGRKKHLSEATEEKGKGDLHG